MSANKQIEKEIREAYIFLRENNMTVPSETLQFMLDASLDKLNDSTIVIKENTGIKDFAIQVVKYLEDHYGEHNYKAFLEVVNDKCSPTNIYELEWYVNGKWSVKERYHTFEKAELHKNILIKDNHYSTDELRVVCQEVF